MRVPSGEVHPRRYPRPRFGVGSGHLDDRPQSCLYNADGTNQHVDTLDRRTLEILATFGRSAAGEFHWVHNLATDSEGNLYTAEVDTGKRAQKFGLVDRQASRRAATTATAEQKTAIGDE